MSVLIERLDSSEFVPATDIVYVDVFGLFPLFDHLAYRANLILVGPKGVAKSTSVTSYAAQTGAHLVTFDCSEDVRRSQLLGMHHLRGNETPFVLGPVTTAVEVANETGKCILALEELNALLPQQQKILNAITDYRRKIEVPECKKVFRLKPGAQLWVVGTMNTEVYGGVYALNEDLKSRFRMLSLGYPSPKQEKQVILTLIASKQLPEIDEQLIDRVLVLAHETRQQALEYALSTRDVVQILGDIAAMSIPIAIRLMLGKFEGADFETVKVRASSIFNLTESATPSVKKAQKG